MSTDSTDTADSEREYTDGDRRPAVKARFDPDVFESINKIRRDRGVEWSTVVLHGISEIERRIPPYHERYRAESSGAVDDDSR
jgi:hypothetical protein